MASTYTARLARGVAVLAHEAAGASNGTAETGATKKKAKPIEYVKTTTGYWHWYIVAGIIGFLTVLNLTRLFHAYLQCRRGLKRGAAGLAEKPTALPVSIAWNTSSVLVNNFLFVRSFPLALYKGTNVTEVFFSLAYLGVCLGLTMYKTYQFGRYNIELPFGMMCYVQIPLIVGLASRNNTISYLTGISYQNLNYLHRAAARVCFLFSWIHTISYCVKGLGKHGPGNDVFWTGVMALIAFTIVTVSSFALARRVMYETFLVLHIVFVLLFLIGCYMHRPKPALQAWIIAGFVIWGFDRLVSLLRMAIINKVWLMPFQSRRKQCSECTIELVTKDVVRLTVPRPLMRWGAGQHALLTMPSVAKLRYEQHPFSFANVPTKSGDGPAIFVIRAHDGFTRRIIDHLDGQTTSSIPCYLDGPYGISHSYTHHDSVLLIAGGTGITHVLSVFLSVIQSHRLGTSAVKSLRLVWNVRHLADVNWVAPLINEALATLIPEDLEVSLDVHLTRSHVADEPDMTRGITELIAEHHNSTVNTRSEAQTPMTELPVMMSEKHRPGSSDEGDSAGTSSTTSANASREKLEQNNEKRLVLEDLPKISGAVAGMTRFRAGRAVLRDVMREEVDKASTSMGVSVCGPLALSLDTRAAVREVNTAARVYNGQAPIELSVEKFGW